MLARILSVPMAHCTVRLRNAVFYAHHGVYDEEHRMGGRYEVDVVMHLRSDEATRTDDLEATVDYEQVHSAVRHVVTAERYDLMERLAGRIAECVMALGECVDWMEVTVRKPNPPIGGTADCVEVTYSMACGS